ncbi:MAG: DNA mismatch repair protein MutL [Herpetosiphonaceae bacterium]|nr:MAG: DNA mismatch repair protein MutL [Herpetosiphonaceae bacterium]
MPIHILEPTVAAQIAAGEVVERPASVVKELVENAIDAGARQIRIEARGGGQREIRVQDDGCGIRSDEVETAFLRHATSKLRSAEDLFNIKTLGFRGEALPSIASVSQVICITRAADEELGTELRIAGGEIQGRMPRGCTPGTSFTIKNLFYNTPARLKFMRSEATEMSQISAIVTQYALAYPEIRFTLLLDGRLALQTPGNGKLLDAIIDIYGPDVARSLLAVDSAAGEGEDRVAVSGYVSQPSLQRSARNYMHLFVNRRAIQPRGALVYVIEEAYHTMLMKGRHPMVVLNIEVDPSEVDVNVHPTKSEVKFRRQDRVFAVLTRAIRSALAEQMEIREWAGGPQVVQPTAETLQRRVELRNLGRGGDVRLRPSAEADELFPERTPASQAPLPLSSTGGEPTPAVEDGDSSIAHAPSAESASAGPAFRQPAPAAQESPQRQEGIQQPGAAKLPVLRVVGQVAETYIVAEGPDGLYLIDQHAAHERVVYERLMNQRGGQLESQRLLMAQAVELPPAAARTLGGHLDLLGEWGFEAEEFGDGTIMVRAVPQGIQEQQIADALLEIADHLSGAGGSTPEDWREAMLTTIACHSAVRAGKTLSHEEMRQLLQQLERCAMPRTCPHGRPTMLQISQTQLERQFGRRG